MNVSEYDQLPSRRSPVPNGEMFAVEVGTGPVVVLVHGSPVSSLEFRTVIARLRRRFHVLAPDLLNFGRSSGPSDGLGFSGQAEALRAFLDVKGVDRFDLVAHDWGGPIGLAAAMRCPAQ